MVNRVQGMKVQGKMIQQKAEVIGLVKGHVEMDSLKMVLVRFLSSERKHGIMMVREVHQSSATLRLLALNHPPLSISFAVFVALLSQTSPTPS